MVKVSILLPTAHRPKSVLRALNCVFSQETKYSWELFFAGDNAPYFEEIVTSETFLEQKRKAEEAGNKVHIWNNPESCGSPGVIINQAIQRANSEYFMFYADDDFIHKNHIENYVSAIDGTDNDMMYFSAKIVSGKDGTPVSYRNTVLQSSRIGHSELVVKTDVLKKAPAHNDSYGHDWDLINWFITTHKKCVRSNNDPTYVVCVHKAGGFKGEPSDPWNWKLDV